MQRPSKTLFFIISSKLRCNSLSALWLQKCSSEIDHVGLHIIAFLEFCTLRLLIYEGLLAGFVVVVLHCRQVWSVVCIHASWKESQHNSVLSCLPQSVNWRVCRLSGQRGVKRNPADSNKHHTFQSSWGCKKIMRPVNSLSGRLC